MTKRKSKGVVAGSGSPLPANGKGSAESCSSADPQHPSRIQSGSQRLNPAGSPCSKKKVCEKGNAGGACQ